jgi:hypothetical protein
MLWKRKNSKNQQWTIVYLDGKKEEAKDGLNTDFGLYINRPFYLISKMSMRRVVTIVNGK